MPAEERKFVVTIEEITLSEAATKAWNGPGKARIPEARITPGVMERRMRGLPDYERPPLGDRVDDGLAKQLQQSMERNAELSGTVSTLKEHLVLAVSERDKLLAQLPDGMKHCTIVFEECGKGHGSLRGANWVQQECLSCRIQRQMDTIRKQRRALRWVADNPTAHSENVCKVAEEGMDP